MRYLFRLISWSVRLLRSLSKGVLLLLMAASLALSVATVTISSVFTMVSSVAEAVLGPRTVRARQESRFKSLRTENAALKNQNLELSRNNDRLKRELANSSVNYRGTTARAREAVKDTSHRVARRVTLASTRNVASVFAESLPFVGVGVIVAATALELRDSCELMKDLHELDVAFNPESAVDGTEVCGMRVPDRAEVWQSIRESPAAVWGQAKEYMPDLPDFSESYASGLVWVTGLACRVMPCDGDATTPE